MKIFQRTIAAAKMAGLFALVGISGSKANAPAKPTQPARP